MKTKKSLKRELELWRETCEILSDKKLMKSIDRSLKQIAKKEVIPLSQL